MRRDGPPHRKGDLSHLRIVAAGATDRAQIIATGATTCAEMFQILIPNEYIMKFIVVMRVYNSIPSVDAI